MALEAPITNYVFLLILTHNTAQKLCFLSLHRYRIGSGFNCQVNIHKVSAIKIKNCKQLLKSRTVRIVLEWTRKDFANNNTYQNNQRC